MDTTARMVRPQFPAPAAVAAVLLLLAAVVLAERLHTADQPPDRDLGGYSVIGHEMLRGRPLYTDLWDRKPPLLYLTFAAAERVAASVRSVAAVSPSAPVLPRMRAGYDAVPVKRDFARPTFRLFARRGGDLSRRIIGPASRPAPR